MIDFPPSPSVGQVFQGYQWNGYAWEFSQPGSYIKADGTVAFTGRARFAQPSTGAASLNIPVPGAVPSAPNDGDLWLQSDGWLRFKRQGVGTPEALAYGSDVATKQNALGFTPVQQGTGVGQLTNVIKIGHSAGGYPKLTVDVTDFGRIWAELNQGAVLNVPGYFKFPNGWLIQWGAGSGDQVITFPLAFPGFCAAINLTPVLGSVPTAGQMWSCMVYNRSQTGFSGYLRYFAGGGGNPIVGSESWFWQAVGW